MIGCDIVAISRIEKIAKRHKQAFLDKFLNAREQELILKKPCFGAFNPALNFPVNKNLNQNAKNSNSYANLNPKFDFENLNFATLAGLFAAKEAASKALGVGICKECSFFDIEISKSIKGAPLIQFSNEVTKRFKIKHASLSIAHEKEFAIAICALEFSN